MARVEGETLEAIRARDRGVSEAEVRRFLACADRALTYLHGRGVPVVHRNLKPGNVVRRADGSYVLVDFGSVSESLARRGASTFVGTIGYMAPEQLQGRALPASDVYAVGATALAALTGEDAESWPIAGCAWTCARRRRGGRRRSSSRARADARADPDLRATSVGEALERLATRAPPPVDAIDAIDAASARPSGDEDALVKSLRRLSWMLRGIGWVIVPVLLGEMLHEPAAIPLVMFSWLSLNILLGWHKGAMLRAMVRQWKKETASVPERQRKRGTRRGAGARRGPGCAGRRRRGARAESTRSAKARSSESGRAESRVVRRGPRHEPALVELEHLDGEPPGLVAVVERDALRAGEDAEELEAQVRYERERRRPVRADRLLAAEDSGGLARDVDDARRGHFEGVVVVGEHAREVVRVPRGDRFLGEVAGGGGGSREGIAGIMGFGRGRAKRDEARADGRGDEGAFASWTGGGRERFRAASKSSPSSRGPGPRLFTSLTRVRLPLGTQTVRGYYPSLEPRLRKPAYFLRKLRPRR